MNAMPKLTLVSDRERALDALATSPAARKALVDHGAETLKKRSELVAERAQLDETAAREHPKLRRDFDAAQAEFTTAQNAFYAAGLYNAAARAAASAAGILAQAKAAAAQHKLTVASFAYLAASDRLELELRRTASPAIALFVSEMRDAWHATRNKPVETRSHLVRNPITRQTSETIASNGASFTRRLTAIRAAMAAAEAMALEANQVDVEVRLEKLRQGLPAIGAPEIPTK